MKIEWLPLLIQGLIMSFDEIYFHRKRGLGRWERLGHPVDTLFFGICALIAMLGFEQNENGRILFLIAGVVSCLVITKDEFVHTEECPAMENWLHSLLFVLHPICLYSVWSLANSGDKVSSVIIFFGVVALFLYQFIYWNILKGDRKVKKHINKQINNAVYDDLGENWYEAKDNPIALLRAEARVKNPWVQNEISSRLGVKPQRILDVGCGAGFLTGYLATKNHYVTGLDSSSSSLEIAKKHDSTQTIAYVCGDAYKLPFEDNSFDVVCAMDFLEHIEDPQRIVNEASRVLRPGGILFFHTFNRNWLSGFVVIKLIELFVKDTPENVHVYHLFIKPKELENYCKKAGLKVKVWKGIRPRIFSWPAMKLAFSGNVDPDFKFDLTNSLNIGYLGIAENN